MISEHTFNYRGLVLKCEPAKMQDGRYAAQLRIEFETGGLLHESLCPVLPFFNTEMEAVVHAKELGVQWADFQLEEEFADTVL